MCSKLLGRNKKKTLSDFPPDTLLLTFDDYLHHKLTSTLSNLPRYTTLITPTMPTHSLNVFSVLSMSDIGTLLKATKSSSEFSEFAKTWDFKHITSRPYYPRSNGLAERMVQTVKRVLHKTTDFYKSLLLLRTTPIDCHLPAELLFNRRLTTILPSRTHSAIDTDTHSRLIK